MDAINQIKERLELIKAHQSASVTNSPNATVDVVKMSKDVFEKAVKEQNLQVYTKAGLDQLKQDIQIYSKRLEKSRDGFDISEGVKQAEEFFKGLVRVEVDGSILYVSELEKGKTYKQVKVTRDGKTFTQRRLVGSDSEDENKTSDKKKQKQLVNEVKEKKKGDKVTYENKSYIVDFVDKTSKTAYLRDSKGIPAVDSKGDMLQVHVSRLK